MEEIRLQPIGYIRNNQARDPREKNWAEIKSEIILNLDLSEALEGIEEYSHIVVIFWLDRVTERGRKIKKISCQKIERKTQGILATHVPYRPNPIGVTIVKLISVRENVLEVLGLDAFDGSPVLDIKPLTGYPNDYVTNLKVSALDEKKY